MRLKIGNCVFEISFSFLALILIFLTGLNNRNLILVFIFALLHEAVHLISICLFTTAPKKVSLTLFGAEIIRGTTNINYNYEIIINLSAPLFNLCVGFMPLLFRITDMFSKEITEVNIFLGFFNMIPFYNFDGGNALRCFLLKYTDEETTEKIMLVISVLVVIAFSFFTVFVFLNFKKNYSLVLICIYMTLSIIFKK